VLLLIAVVACDRPPDERNNGAWFLVVPPFYNITPDTPASVVLNLDDMHKKFGWYPNEDAPIREWDQVAAFDSAKECEAERHKPLVHGDIVRDPEMARCVPSQALYPQRDN
jgi:hypothetical protein